MAGRDPCTELAPLAELSQPLALSNPWDDTPHLPSASADQQWLLLVDS